MESEIENEELKTCQKRAAKKDSPLGKSNVESTDWIQSMHSVVLNKGVGHPKGNNDFLTLRLHYLPSEIYLRAEG